jgi:hypothetical protein
MRTVESLSKRLVCDVCDENIVNAAVAGLELNCDAMSRIGLCHHCGPIDLDLMQICREVTIGCADN